MKHLIPRDNRADGGYGFSDKSTRSSVLFADIPGDYPD
jgi:hypothetical protein